ncbi:hypothetical protein JKF63_02729 [Porcisia hertigi]|uniref:Uncharacterized protein n=1 Tax=Porcisia hertigi TaxID=2761500 RepID=A0A836I1G7_9TRYP|nr:hypothetical protein JKF63_02729 [Porcisia hertigi]
MMTSLPVLHLKATSQQNVTIAVDPYDATATLYTFLRSIPSKIETELALQPFLESLHTAPSSGRASIFRKPNHRLVQLLDSVATDDVFRRTPHVLPALARHSDQWVRRLGCASIDNDKTGESTSAMHSKEHAAIVSQGSTPYPTTVRAADLREYADPYTAYKVGYARRHDSAHSPHLENRTSDEATTSHRSSAETRGPPYCSITQPREEALSVSAEVSALTVPGDESQLHETAQDGLCEESPAPKPAVTSASAIHPVLQLIASTVVTRGEEDTAVVEGERHGDTHEDPLRSRSSTATRGVIEEKLHKLRARLNDAEAELVKVMEEEEAAEQAWSPFYSRVKTSRMYIEELKGRLQSAASLYLLQRYECETLQQAHVGVAMESMSLELVLRDVRARLEDEKSSSLTEGPHQMTAGQRLAQQLRDIFALPAAVCQHNTAMNS